MRTAWVGIELEDGTQRLMPWLGARGLAHVLDEATLTLGTGCGSRSYSLTELPFVADVPWDVLRDVPAARERREGIRKLVDRAR